MTESIRLSDGTEVEVEVEVNMAEGEKDEARSKRLERYEREDAVHDRELAIRERHASAVEQLLAEHGEGFVLEELQTKLEELKLSVEERRDAIEFRAWLRQREDRLFEMIERQNEILGDIAQTLGQIANRPS